MGEIEDLVLNNKLTKEARQAMNFAGQYLLIEAGPGTGKTTCIGCKVYKLILHDRINPEALLLLAFTNSAKNEMRDKLEEEEKIETDNLKISTLHSLAKNLIITFQDKSRFNPDFTLIAKDLMKIIDADLKEEVSSLSMTHCEAMRKALEKSKMRKEKVSETDQPKLKNFNQAYVELMEFYNTVSFADLINEAIRLLEANKDIKEVFAKELQYVLVDEYQDLNPAEQGLVSLLVDLGSKLMVVGDGNQSICGYREANPSAMEIEKFTKEFPNALKIVFSESFRCPANILKATSGFMGNAPQKSKSKNRGRIYEKCLKTEKKEVEWIAREIKKITTELKLKKKKKEIFILSPETSILKNIEEELTKADIPVNVWWKSEFEIGKIMPYLDFLENKNNNFALRLCLEDEFGIGTKGIKRLRDFAKKEDVSLWDALLKAMSKKEFIIWQSKFKNFIKEIEIFEKAVSDGNITELLKRIIDRKKFQPSEKLNNLFERVTRLKRRDLKDLRKLLEERETLDFPSIEKGGAVVLSTVNKAKGRGADIVFIPAVGEKTFGRSVDFEERRRMLYVAMTRARESLYLSWSKRIRGKMGRCDVDFNKGPCCFIQKIPEGMIEKI